MSLKNIEICVESISYKKVAFDVCVHVGEVVLFALTLL